MKDRSRYTEGLFTGLGITALLLCLSIFISNWVSPIQYQIPTRNINPSSTPANINELTTRVENLENDQAYNFKNFEWRLDQKILYLGWIALAISVVAGFFGIRTFNDLDHVVQERVNAKLEQALYQLDPTNLQIWVISREEEHSLFNTKTREYEKVDLVQEMERVQERLQLSGLPHVQVLELPDKKCYRGVTIVPIFSQEMEDEFIKFLVDNKKFLDKERSAFVLYTSSYLVDKSTLTAYPNLATANMPATAASMILTVGRGLKNTKPEKKEKEEA